MAAVVLLASSPPSMDSTALTGIPFSQIHRYHLCIQNSRLCRPVQQTYAQLSRTEGSFSPAAKIGFCGCGGALIAAARNSHRGENIRLGLAKKGFSGGESDEEEEDRSREWEEQLRSRIKDLEESKELERRAEEVQRRIMAEEGESEEQKRERVRVELQKVLNGNSNPRNHQHHK